SLRGIHVDMASTTDCFMTLAAVAAVATGVTRITGVANQRVKECNRIAAMAQGLRKLGVTVFELPDGLEIHGDPSLPTTSPGARIECFADHRIAMSFTVLATIVPAIVIDDAACVDKTYPTFWDDLETKLHFSIHGMGVDTLPLSSAASSRRCSAADMSATSLTAGAASTRMLRSPSTLTSVGAGFTTARIIDGPTPSKPFKSNPLCIVFIGMRGAGKTTAAQIAHQMCMQRLMLASGATADSTLMPSGSDDVTMPRMPTCEYVDMDAYLSSRMTSAAHTPVSINVFVATNGWPAFRAMEQEALAYWLAYGSERREGEPPVVTLLSCGGGVVETPACRDMLRAHAAAGGKIVYFQRDIHDIISDMEIADEYARRVRPPYPQGASVEETFERRKAWYEQCSTLVFRVPRGRRRWYDSHDGMQRDPSDTDKSSSAGVGGSSSGHSSSSGSLSSGGASASLTAPFGGSICNVFAVWFAPILSAHLLPFLLVRLPTARPVVASVGAGTMLPITPIADIVMGRSHQPPGGWSPASLPGAQGSSFVCLAVPSLRSLVSSGKVVHERSSTHTLRPIALSPPKQTSENVLSDAEFLRLADIVGTAVSNSVALEIRADHLLHSCADEDDLWEAVAQMRFALTHAAINRAPAGVAVRQGWLFSFTPSIIFTCRTRGEGGLYDVTDGGLSYGRLLANAVRNGVSTIDVEFGMQSLIRDVAHPLLALPSMARTHGCGIIASCHWPTDGSAAPTDTTAMTQVVKEATYATTATLRLLLSSGSEVGYIRGPDVVKLVLPPAAGRLAPDAWAALRAAMVAAVEQPFAKLVTPLPHAPSAKLGAGTIRANIASAMWLDRHSTA
ncbi:type I 3-dehydroquinate dehydratase, partial [archaeon]